MSDHEPPNPDDPGQSDSSGDSGASGESTPANQGPANPGPGGSSGNPQDPFAMLFGQLGGGDMNQLLQQVQQALGQLGFNPASGTPSGSIGFQAPGAAAAPSAGANVRDIARKTAASQGNDPVPSRASADAIADAVRLAQSWLDAATELPASSTTAQAWSRAQWVEHTMEVWQRLIEPVTTSMGNAMAETMNFGDAGPEAQMLAGMEQMLKPMLRTSGAQMFGMQAGQGIGAVAGDVLSGTDNGLPLVDSATVALLPANIDDFVDGLDGDTNDLRIYLALRESARQRLFAHASWLRPQFLTLVEEYAKQLTIDTSRLEEIVGSGGMDPDTLQQIAQQLQNNTLFVPARTADQDRILERLETLLALVEGWVDDVVTTAAERWLPNAESLSELIRRRRGAGGPAEETLTKLVGLELRPRKVREAAKLWQLVRQRSGVSAREAAWTHPDLLPRTSDLADPLGYQPTDATSESSDLDAELFQLLDDQQGRAEDHDDSDPDNDDSR